MDRDFHWLNYCCYYYYSMIDCEYYWHYFQCIDMREQLKMVVMLVVGLIHRVVTVEEEVVKVHEV